MPECYYPSAPMPYCHNALMPYYIMPNVPVLDFRLITRKATIANATAKEQYRRKFGWPARLPKQMCGKPTFGLAVLVIRLLV